MTFLLSKYSTALKCDHDSDNNDNNDDDNDDNDDDDDDDYDYYYYYYYYYYHDSLPVLLPDLSSKSVSSVSASYYYTACVTKAGEMFFTWGYGEYGKLGHVDGSYPKTPKRVNYPSKVWDPYLPLSNDVTLNVYEP